jgi:hypothetical protein
MGKKGWEAGEILTPPRCLYLAFIERDDPPLSREEGVPLLHV